MDDIVIPTEGLVEKFESQFLELKKEITNPNILILGQTGTGKSSLINTIFGKNIAQVNNTKPQTRGFQIYSEADIPINIIDSEGYELANSSTFKSMINDFLNKNFDNIKNQIHLVWYCISISSNRVLPYDIENLAFILEKNLPVCVVLTQADNDTPEGTIAKSLQDVITNNFGERIPCFQVSNDEIINQSLQLNNLLDWSQNNLSEENLRLGFIVAQKKNLAIKQDKVESRIKYYGATAATIGATPIPVSDAILLTSLQVKMCADIFAIYGLDNTISSTVKNVIGGQVVSLMGKTLAGNLIKFIPGIGTVGGAVINAGVATSITVSMGYAISRLTKKCIENQLTGKFMEELPIIFNQDNLNKLIDEFIAKNKECKPNN